MKGSFLIQFKGLLLLNWSFVQGLPEDIEVGREEVNGRSRQLQVFLKKKRYDFFPQFGPVGCRVLLFIYMCHVLGKKFSFFWYIGITICVYVLNKSRGSEMHWVGRGFNKKN